ncbi:hypothetical protein MJD09_16460 [bacterium]|nr:hypothetical protein [bacterium]
MNVGTSNCIWIHTGDDGSSPMEGYNIIIDDDWSRFGRCNGYDMASEYLG